MRVVIRSLIAILAVSSACGAVRAGDRGPKKPLDVYLRTAKIEIVEGRNDSAIVYLDELFRHYGHHAEALYWMAQIMVDFLEKTSGPEAQRPHLEALVAYIDSLEICCGNKEIKKKYRKDCKEYLGITDSLKVKYWRRFFNDGLRQFNLAEEMKEDVGSVEDSIVRVNMEEDIGLNIDSCITNLTLAVTAIPDSTRPYLILDKAFGIRGDYSQGVEWLTRAYQVTDDSATIQQSLAYDYIQMDDYCGAIPFYRDFLKGHPENVGIMMNVAICYERCGQSDSAVVFYRRLLEADPDNVDAMSSLGHYFNSQARLAADSASRYMSEDSQDEADAWSAKKTEAFDSARVYFREAFGRQPDDPVVAELYAVISALLGDYQEATIGFAKLTELDPGRAGNWTYLGDCYLSLKEFNQAIAAYEQVVELQPGNLNVWEHLVDLYIETGQQQKKTAALKKVQELKQ